MMSLTPQEKRVLLFLVTMLVLGSALEYVFKRYPDWRAGVNVMESKRIYPKINLNTATAEELEALPYIGAYTAQNILRYREDHGPFKTIDDLKAVKGVREKNFAVFSRYLRIR